LSEWRGTLPRAAPPSERALPHEPLTRLSRVRATRARLRDAAARFRASQHEHRLEDEITRSRSTERQIIGVLNEADTGVKVRDLVRKHGIAARP
jgi:hypothetical protein